MIKKIAKKIVRSVAKIRFIERIIFYIIKSKNAVVVYYNDPIRARTMHIIKKIRSETEMLMHDNEAYQVYMLAEKTAKIKGDIAEVGVYTGGSAKLICEAKEDRALHLFDTFNGLPSLSKNDNQKQFYAGQFSASLDSVKNYLKGYKKVYFYKGIFPNTAKPIKNKKFSFVHLDVDIYKSTLDCLKFFYPRMRKGGIIISHDYINAPGVKKAIDEFFEDKPEPIIEICQQAMIVKIR